METFQNFAKEKVDQSRSGLLLKICSFSILFAVSFHKVCNCIYNLEDNNYGNWLHCIVVEPHRYMCGAVPEILALSRIILCKKISG